MFWNQARMRAALGIVGLSPKLIGFCILRRIARASNQRIHTGQAKHPAALKCASERPVPALMALSKA